VRSKRGVTLPELLISMVVMLLIAGVISALYFASLQVWRRCSSQSQADPPAHMAIARLSKELRNAYKVSSMGSSSIGFLLPKTDSNGVNIVPFETAREIAYYVSDGSGEPGRPGTTLWRREVVTQTGAVKLQQIAQNVQQLAFDYETTGESRVLAIYALSITVIGREGRQQYSSQFGSHIAFRNP